MVQGTCSPENIRVLFENVIDQVLEAQLKLDYVKETISLFYVIPSLERILGVHSDLEGKSAARDLSKLLAAARDESGTAPASFFRFSPHEDHVTVTVSSEGVAWISENRKPSAFLEKVISYFASHEHATKEELTELFGTEDSGAVCHTLEKEKAEALGFDYVLYFPKGEPDRYYYCIHEEMGHTVYHRFLPEDYAGFL